MKQSGEPRSYRQLVKAAHLVGFNVAIAESDLHISAEQDLSVEACTKLRECRRELAGYIAARPDFRSSLSPLEVGSDAPPLVQAMAQAASRAGVGPMAAVAGAIAEAVGRHLLSYTSEVIVENGGDIFMRSLVSRRASIFAGHSPFSLKVALDLPPSPDGLGICTSAGTVGHSLSFGRADAVVILAPDAALADAWATAIGNIVKTKEDIQSALDQAAVAEGLIGAVVIIGNALGAWGDVQLTQA